MKNRALRSSTLVADRKPASNSLARILLELVVSHAKVWEGHHGVLYLDRDIADRLAPLTLSPADGLDESLHTVKRHVADLPNPLRVDGSVRALEILGVGVDEDCPREVMVGRRCCGSGRRSRCSAAGFAEEVEFGPDLIVLLCKGTGRRAVSGNAVIVLASTECHLLNCTHLRYPCQRRSVGILQDGGCAERRTERSST
jgi:hypothetical protein